MDIAHEKEAPYLYGAFNMSCGYKILKAYCLKIDKSYANRADNTIGRKTMDLQFKTQRLVLKILNKADAPALLDYFSRNASFLEPWEVTRDETFYSIENMETLISDDLMGLKAGHTLRFWIAKREEPNRIIGSVALSNIIRGVFQSSFIGYRLDEKEINKGYMTEAINEMVLIAFRRLKLHRLEANIIPRNKRSIRTVEKAGFEYEGISKKYLKINGVWEDHIHMVILNEEVE